MPVIAAMDNETLDHLLSLNDCKTYVGPVAYIKPNAISATAKIAAQISASTLCMTQRSSARKKPRLSRGFIVYLLASAGERPGSRRAAEPRDELAPLHVWMAPAWQEKM